MSTSGWTAGTSSTQTGVRTNQAWRTGEAVSRFMSTGSGRMMSAPISTVMFASLQQVQHFPQMAFTEFNGS